MNEVERKEYRNFIIRGIIYCIIFLVTALTLNIKSNTFFTGAVTVFIYVIALGIDMKISIKRTIKKLEELQN